MRSLLFSTIIALLAVLAGYVAANTHNVVFLVLFLFTFLVPVALVRPDLAIYAWLAVSAVVNVIWQGGISARLSIHAVMAFFLAITLISRMSSKTKRPKIFWWEWLYPVFVLVCMISTIREPARFINPLVLFKSLMLPYVFYWFGREFLVERRQFNIMSALAIVTGTWVAMVGYYEYHSGSHVWAKLLSGPTISRAVGPYITEITYGIMQVLHLLLGIYLIRSLPRKRWYTNYGYAIGIPLLIMIGYSTVLASQRAIVMALVITLAVQIYYLRRRVWSAIFIVSALTFFAFNYTYFVDSTVIDQKFNVSDISAKSRIAQYMSAMMIGIDKPLTGIGYSYFDNPRRTDKYTTYFMGASSRGKLIHNSMLYSFATSGMLAALPFLLFKLSLLLYLFRAVGRSRGQPEHLMIVTGLSLALVHFLVDQANILSYSEIANSAFFLFIGTIVGHIRRTQQSYEAAVSIPSAKPLTHSEDINIEVPSGLPVSPEAEREGL